MARRLMAKVCTFYTIGIGGFIEFSEFKCFMHMHEFMHVTTLYNLLLFCSF